MARRPQQAGGLLITDLDTGKQTARDTYTCRHCNRIVIVQPMQRPEDIGRRCGGCDGLLCVACSARDGCSHIEKRCDAIARREQLRNMG